MGVVFLSVAIAACAAALFVLVGVYKTFKESEDIHGDSADVFKFK